MTWNVFIVISWDIININARNTKPSQICSRQKLVAYPVNALIVTTNSEDEDGGDVLIVSKKVPLNFVGFIFCLLLSYVLE